MIERSFLPAVEFEFAVLADTHYMQDPGSEQVEFQSRRLQTARIERVLGLVESLEVDFVVHLGDLTQNYPEAEGYHDSLDQALGQLKKRNLNWRFVAGNHDVGDKPDPTMPTEWVSEERLSHYHRVVGPSWYSWDRNRRHFVVLNSQILNSALPQAAAQNQWLEEDLAAHRGRPVFMFMHLPLYLENEAEPDLGHYDNIGQPARRRLLSLIREYGVKLVFAGHSHYPFFDNIGATKYYVAASPSFTRPGFGEMFSSCPPPERGRNDQGKLGFYLVRVGGDNIEVHFIRTGGETAALGSEPDYKKIVPCLSSEYPDSPMGLTLRHPLSWRSEVPIAFPSTIRQKVRNDCQMLAITELGCRHLRVPAADFQDEFQRQRLTILRNQGVGLTAFWLWSEGLDLVSAILPFRDLLDGMEIQLVGLTKPGPECLDLMAALVSQSGLETTLSTLIPNERVRGKQHDRPRFGFLPGELPELIHHLSKNRPGPGRITARLEPGIEPWETVVRGRWASRPDRPFAIDWLVEMQTTDESEQTALAAEALFAGAALGDSRIFLEPVIDLDRTMDAAFGLLDRLDNPRPAFRAVSCLNTILFNSGGKYSPREPFQFDGVRVLGLDGKGETLLLLLPDRSNRDGVEVDIQGLESLAGISGTDEYYDLGKGAGMKPGFGEDRDSQSLLRPTGPILLVVRY